MRKGYLVGVLCLLWISTAVSDPLPDNPKLDSLLTRQSVSYCADFVHNARLIIPRLYEREQIDSIRLVIDYIRGRCSPNLFEDLSDLLAVRDGSFDRDICDSAFLEESIFAPRWRSWFSLGCFSDIYPGAPPDSFGVFINQLNELLLNDFPGGSDERFILLYHAVQVDQILEELSDSLYAGLCVQDVYDARVAELLSRRYDARANVFGLAGVWSGLGANELLGVKPELGVGVGLRRNRWGLDLVALMRFLNSRESYQVKYRGELESTKAYVGGFIGLDGTLETIRSDKHGLELVGFLGYEGFQAISDNENDVRGVDMFSFGWGINYRLFYTRPSSRYFGLQFRHTLSEYDNAPGTDLSGHGISVRLVFGSMPSPGTDWNLERLHYNRR